MSHSIALLEALQQWWRAGRGRAHPGWDRISSYTNELQVSSVSSSIHQKKWQKKKEEEKAGKCGVAMRTINMLRHALLGRPSLLFRSPISPYPIRSAR